MKGIVTGPVIGEIYEKEGDEPSLNVKNGKLNAKKWKTGRSVIIM